MPQQVESATITMLDRISEHDIGRKLRIAGRMLSYDAETALVLLHDSSNALLVDVSLCIDPEGFISTRNMDTEWKDPNVHHWALERKSHMWVVGYLERAESQLPIPMLPAFSSSPSIDPSLVLRAVIIAPVTRDFSTAQVRDMLAGMANLPVVPYPV